MFNFWKFIENKLSYALLKMTVTTMVRRQLILPGFVHYSLTNKAENVIKASGARIRGSWTKIGFSGAKVGPLGPRLGALGSRLGALWPRLRTLGSRLGLLRLTLGALGQYQVTKPPILFPEDPILALEVQGDAHMDQFWVLGVATSSSL